MQIWKSGTLVADYNTSIPRRSYHYTPKPLPFQDKHTAVSLCQDHSPKKKLKKTDNTNISQRRNNSTPGSKPTNMWSSTAFTVFSL
jgi:hypothetical protein